MQPPTTRAYARALAVALDRDPAELVNRASLLVTAGVLPKKGRGRAAARIDAASAALVLLSLLGPQHRAPEQTRRLAALMAEDVSAHEALDELLRGEGRDGLLMVRLMDWRAGSGGGGVEVRVVTRAGERAFRDGPRPPATAPLELHELRLPRQALERAAELLRATG